MGEILRGEAYLAIGYSEPAGGTDLVNLTTPRGARRRRLGHQRPEDLNQLRETSPSTPALRHAQTRIRWRSEILSDASLIASGPDVVLDGLAESFWREGSVHMIGVL